MNPNNQPLKLTTAAEDLARQVFPIAKQFVTDQVAARQDRTLQQPQLQRPRRSIIGKAAGYLNRFLHPPNRPNDYQARSLTSNSRLDRTIRIKYPQGRELEIRECLKAHNEGSCFIYCETSVLGYTLLLPFQHPRNHPDTFSSARRSAPGRPRAGLKWDERLAIHAQQWAAHLIRHGTFEHDTSGTGEGENLFIGLGRGSRQSVPLRRRSRRGMRRWCITGGRGLGKGRWGSGGIILRMSGRRQRMLAWRERWGGRGRQVVVARYSPPGNVVGRSAFE